MCVFQTAITGVSSNRKILFFSRYLSLPTLARKSRGDTEVTCVCSVDWSLWRTLSTSVSVLLVSLSLSLTGKYREPMITCPVTLKSPSLRSQLLSFQEFTFQGIFIIDGLISPKFNACYVLKIGLGALPRIMYKGYKLFMSKTLGGWLNITSSSKLLHSYGDVVISCVDRKSYTYAQQIRPLS